MTTKAKIRSVYLSERAEEALARLRKETGTENISRLISDLLVAEDGRRSQGA